MVSSFVTICGTAIAVTITAMAGYAISRNSLKYRNFFALAFYFTMVFNGGLVPWYMMVSNLGLRDSVWALIVPMAFNPFNMLLMRNFFKTLPDSIVESGKLDGAGELRIFRSLILPISMPGLATITLFYMLAFWNDWWLALLFIDNYRLYPLQFLLRKIQSNILYVMQGMNTVVKQSQIPKETVQMAMCAVTIGPIVFVYPFIQRYFIKGITIGAVKG
jgi:putative aldouronate transport system permease protein